MYKNPQTSDQARRLRDELAKFDIKLPHAQALEVVARLAGERTLHVAQAKNNAGVRIAAVARRQAQAVMFVSLGRFEGNFEGLLAELQALALLANSDDAAALDRAFRALFRSEGAPELRAGFDLRAEEVLAEFNKLVGELTAVLVAEARAPAQAPDEGLFYQGPMFDWQVFDNGLDAVPEALRQRYEMTLKQAKSGSQFYLDVAPQHQEPEEIDGRPQLGIIVEVNQGVPCVHLTNSLYGDQVLSVFATEDGLYLRPEAQQYIRTGMPDVQCNPALAAVYARDTEGLAPGAMTNCAMIVASNRF
jgi:hypothetical protein